MIDVPTAIASFAMTSLFTYLLWSQVEGGSRGNAAAAVVVVIVAKKTRSMLWCCIAGVVAYVALGALPL